MLVDNETKKILKERKKNCETRMRKKNLYGSENDNSIKNY